MRKIKLDVFRKANRLRAFLEKPGDVCSAYKFSVDEQEEDRFRVIFYLKKDSEILPAQIKKIMDEPIKKLKTRRGYSSSLERALNNSYIKSLMLGGMQGSLRQIEKDFKKKFVKDFKVVQAEVDKLEYRESDDILEVHIKGVAHH